MFIDLNYLGIENSVGSFQNYVNLAVSIGLLFLVLLLPYGLLVWKGFFRNRVLDSWNMLLLLCSFGCFIVPFAALQFWQRWMFMLIYPLTFYSIYGLHRLFNKFYGGRFVFSWQSNLKVLVIIYMVVSLAIGYLATPILITFFGL